MKSTIDPAGRLVIPKEIRRAASLKPGQTLGIECREGRIEIEPAPLPIRLVRKGRLVVAVPTGPRARLTRETVEEVREAIRRERGEKSRR